MAAEVAGIVLGGIPLVILALEKYAEPFDAFHRYRTLIETLRTDLILQTRQLDTTLSNIGLANNPLREALREYFDTKFTDHSCELVERMETITAGLSI